MTLNLEYGIKVQDKIIVQRGESGTNKRKITKKYTGVIMQVEKKSRGNLQSKHNNCIVWEISIAQAIFLQETKIYN